MDGWDRNQIESGLRYAIIPEQLDTFPKALRFLGQKKVVDADVLITHNEEIAAIYDRLRLLPPSPPPSDTSPAEKGGYPSEDDQRTGSDVVPSYDKETRSQPIAFFVPSVMDFRAINSKRCRSKSSCIKASTVKQYQLQKEQGESVVLTWQYPGGFAPPGDVPTVYNTRCRIVEGKDAQEMQVEVLLGDDLQSGLQDASPPNIPAIPAAVQPPTVGTSAGISPVRNDQCPPPLALAQENVLALAGQLNAHTAVLLSSLGCVPGSMFAHQAASMHGGFPAAPISNHTATQQAVLMSGMPLWYPPQTVQPLFTSPYPAQVPSNIQPPQAGFGYFGYSGAQPMNQPTLPGNPPLVDPNVQSSQPTTRVHMSTVPNTHGSMPASIQTNMVNTAYAPYAPHQHHHVPPQQYPIPAPDSANAMNSELDKAARHSVGEEPTGRGIASMLRATAAIEAIGTQFPQGITPEQSPDRLLPEHTGAAGEEAVRAGQEKGTAPS